MFVLFEPKATRAKSHDRLYLYDLGAGRALAVEADTSQEAPLGRDRLDGLIAHLAGRGHSALLRRFAIAAARLSGAGGTEAERTLLAAAEAALVAHDASALEATRAAYNGTAAAAGAVGLAHRAANAAGFLAAFAACHPDAAAAAREAARMAHLWAELSTTGPSADALTQSLSDWLLDHLPAVAERA